MEGLIWDFLLSDGATYFWVDFIPLIKCYYFKPIAKISSFLMR